MTLRINWIMPFIVLISCSKVSNTNEMGINENELKHSSSPYLLQHAQNPVNWHIWSAENLIAAQELGKPLIISIGYSSCHWCHVMEHESFEDEEVAAFMNENFYCIKVDREERPDVDHVYMTAANLLTGRGGWPLNCFALPDGKPFHAGTYYKKSDWLNLLRSVSRQYKEEYSKIEAYANRLTLGIKMQETLISDNIQETLDRDIIAKAIQNYLFSLDLKDGGHQGAPKFPMPSHLNLLLKYNQLSPNNTIDLYIHNTLHSMAHGGIFDQIGGGFSRYSTDPKWKVPHFEKMLYDNAQLIETYAMAYRAYQEPLYLEIIEKTTAWLREEMLDPSGLYYSAIDADSEGEEGLFYTWSMDELQQILGEDLKDLEQFYDLEMGEWEDQRIILMRRTDPLTPEQTRQKKHLDTVLKTTRALRVRPGVDDKCLISWNSLLISGYLAAYNATGDESYFKYALEIYEAVVSILENNNGLRHSYKQGIATITPLLEDHAYWTKALIDLYLNTSDAKYLSLARNSIDEIITHYYSEDNGVFYFNQKNELIVQSIDFYDNVTPSSAATSCQILYLMGLLDGNTHWMDIAQVQLEKMQSNIAKNLPSYTHWTQVHLMMSSPFYELVISGPNAKSLAKEFKMLPYFNLIGMAASDSPSSAIMKGKTNTNTQQYFLCQLGICNSPTSSASEIRKQIDER